MTESPNRGILRAARNYVQGAIMDKIPDRLTLAVPKNLVARAKAKAALQQTSVSAVVRAFLEAWISDQVEVPKQEKSQE